MGPKGIILGNPPITTFQQSLTHSAMSSLESNSSFPCSSSICLLVVDQYGRHSDLAKEYRQPDEGHLQPAWRDYPIVVPNWKLGLRGCLALVWTALKSSGTAAGNIKLFFKYFAQLTYFLSNEKSHYKCVKIYLFMTHEGLWETGWFLWLSMFYQAFREYLPCFCKIITRIWI